MKNYKIILIILLYTVSYANSLLAQEFVFPNFKAYPPFREMKCGLWINAVGDIAYKTIGCGIDEVNEETISDSLKNGEYILDYYITWCYYVRDTTTDYMDENDYMSELKNVVDTTSFKILSSSSFFVDKNHIYTYIFMACGGHICIDRSLDKKTFKIFKSNPDFACDKYNCFVLGRNIKGADPKTFRPINKGQLYSRDKNHVYCFDQPMTEAEIVKAEKELEIQLRPNYSTKKSQVANKKLVDSLKFVRFVPYIENYDDPIFWRIVEKGKEIIPNLINKMTDTKKLKEVYVPNFGGEYTVADVAYQALQEIIKDIPTFDLLGVSFSEDCGYCSYWFHVRASKRNRKKFQHAVREWYEQNKNNLVWVESLIPKEK